MIRKTLVSTVILALLFVFAVLLSYAGTPASSAISSRSVEVGVATVGPAGSSGGLAIPASCPSDLHDAPANYGSGCSSGPNICGQVGSGSIQCNGSCSAGVPSNAGCASLSISPGTINEGNPITINWTCVNPTSTSGGGPAPGPGQSFSTGGAATGNEVFSGPEVGGSHIYQLMCSYPTGNVSAQSTVIVRQPTVSISAFPSFLKEGETSQVSWSAFGVNTCEVSGPGISATAPPPDIAGGATWTSSATTPPLDAESVYTIRCETSVNKYFKQAIINVVPEGEEI